MKKLQNKSGRVRSVGKYDLDGNLIKVYKSVNEAKRENGSCVVNMLRGKQKQQKDIYTNTQNSKLKIQSMITEK